MASVSVMKRSTDRPKTLTLRQWAKAQDGKFPKRVFAKTFFRPGKYSGWSIVTERNFRVSLEDDPEINKAIEQALLTAVTSDMAAFVLLEDAENGVWELSLDTDECASWEEKDWGYTATITHPRPKKTARASKRDAGGTED